jgi:hypothetical protein
MKDMIFTNHLTSYLMPMSSLGKSIVIFLSKCRFDDLGGEHFKIVPFTTKSLSCSMRVGKFNINMLDVVMS